MKKYALLVLLVMPISVFAMDEVSDAEQADGVTNKRTHVEAFGEEDVKKIIKIVVLEKRGVSDPQLEKLKQEAQHLGLIKKSLYELYEIESWHGGGFILPKENKRVQKYCRWRNNHLQQALELYEERYPGRDAEVSDDE